MARTNTPLRMLAKTHANALITRDEYVAIRARMLKKLEAKGHIDDSDLSTFTNLVQKSESFRCLGLANHRPGNRRLGGSGTDSLRLDVAVIGSQQKLLVANPIISNVSAHAHAGIDRISN